MSDVLVVFSSIFIVVAVYILFKLFSRFIRYRYFHQSLLLTDSDIAELSYLDGRFLQSLNDIEVLDLTYWLLQGSRYGVSVMFDQAGNLVRPPTPDLILYKRDNQSLVRIVRT